MRKVVTAMAEYDWVVFTSPNGVDALFRAYFGVLKTLREFGPRIAAVGATTAQKVAEYTSKSISPTDLRRRIAEEFSLRWTARTCTSVAAQIADEKLARGLESTELLTISARMQRARPRTPPASANARRRRDPDVHKFGTITNCATGGCRR
jgi:uroporphyrinogen III methyltransferase/synthase